MEGRKALCLAAEFAVQLPDPAIDVPADMQRIATMPSLRSVVAGVFSMQQQLEMADVDAERILTAMMNVIPIRCGAVVGLPHDAMNPSASATAISR